MESFFKQIWMNSTDKISHNRNIHKKEGLFMSEETEKFEEISNETEVPANEADGAENLGSVNISDDVISVVVGMTLSEIKGICPSGSNFGNIAEMFSGKRNMGKGVKVEVDGESVSMDLHIIVEYGIKIPDVAWEAQEKVKEAVESITGLKVDKINIHVEGVSVVKEQKQEKKVEIEPVEDKEAADELADDLEELKEMDALPTED